MSRAAATFSFLLLTLFAPINLCAIEAGEALADPALEARAVELGSQLRCLVCQSESINDSPASLAKDLRKLVRTKLQDGMGNEAILDYIHQRYGDFVLLKPPVKAATLPLWAAPWAILGVGFLIFTLFLFRKREN